MFKHDDEYARATQSAGIYTYDQREGNNSKLVVLNLLLGGLLGGIIYFGVSSNFLDLNVFKEKFLTINSSTSNSSSELLVSLNLAEVDTVIEKEAPLSREEKQLNLAVAMKNVVESDESESSSYITALSKELGIQKERTVVVQKGDTLATLSAKYYGDARDFDKILVSNPQINKASDTIYIGQKLTLPY